MLVASTAGHSEDMNWRRGVFVLWTLFGLVAVAEACGLAFAFLSGSVSTVPLADLIRLGLLCGVFLLLWLGQSWPRWVLSAVAFFYGGRLIVQVLTANDAALSVPTVAGQPLPSDTLLLVPVLASGFLYLILSGYLAFSSDVLGFTRHRREEGRAWVVLPVTLGLAGFFLAVCISPALFRAWLENQRPDAERASRDTLRAIAEHWDPPTLNALSTPAFLVIWPAPPRNSTLATLSPLGPLRTTDQETFEFHSGFDRSQDNFLLTMHYAAWMRCEHGRAQADLVLVRGLFGPWRVDSFSPGMLTLDKPAEPVPAPVGH